MKKKNPKILSASVCSCRVLDIPPVGPAETEQIIRNRMSAFYPGSPDDLYVDYVKEGDKAVVFYSPRTRIDDLRSEYGDVPLYTVWHFLASIENKEGPYCVRTGDNFDLFYYSGNRLAETKVLSSKPEDLQVHEIPDDLSIPSGYAPLFPKKRKKKYGIPNLLLVTLIIILPQLAFFRQVKMDEKYESLLKKEITRLTAEMTAASTSEDELNLLRNEYDQLISEKPVNLSMFLSELSEALEADVEIESLVLKNGSFRLNGAGFNPLGKMEKFQSNVHFFNVVPYQVKAVEGSSKETFSLTGVYRNE